MNKKPIAHNEIAEVHSGQISLREQVYQYLKDAIADGSVQPGEFLDQGTICKKLHVSKTPLRDALIRLEAEGFVSIFPRKGVQINGVDLEFIRSAYQIIGTVETDCIDEVFEKFTIEHIQAFEESNKRQWQYLQDNKYNEYYNENIFFHNIFLNLSENRLLDTILMPLKRRLYDFPLQKYDYEWEALNLNTHQRFIDSIRYGNREAAKSIFRMEHWSYDVHKKYLMSYYNIE